MPLQPLGILVNAGLYRRIPSRRTKHEMLSFYEEAANYYDMIPCYFRLQDIRASSGKVLAYVPKGVNKGYKRTWMPLPKIVHNRAIYSSSATQERLNRMAIHSFHVFNMCNRYNKLHIYDLLMKNENIRPHLPGTVNATTANLKHYLEVYDSLILKPNNGSIGKGIYKIEKAERGWVLHYKRDKRWRKIYFSKRIPSFLMNRLKKRKYIIQQQLPLAVWNNRPFDLRVSVQKNISGQWQITGIAGKVAPKNGFLTNVAQGGKVYPLHVLLSAYPHLNMTETEDNIKNFALMVASELDQHLPNLADLGLDVGITEHGFPLFIECNGRDQRYSFREAGMIEEWKATYANPVGYARYLADLQP